MRIRLLPSLALFALSFPLAAACGGTAEEPPGTGGGSGAGGASGGAGGTAGTGGAMGGTAGTNATGGTAGTTATGGAAGTTATGGTAGTGTAGTGTAGTGGGAAADSPTDTSQPGLEAFIDAMSYRGADWKSGSDMPNASTSVHSLNRIWYNRTLRQSAAAAMMPHAAGSMVVKEIYTDTNVIGHAAMLRTANAWIYYCVANEAGRCSSTSMPNQASYAMSAGSCACHGAGTIVTGTMIPAP